MEEQNTDYRKMYYHLAGAVETALRILIAAQQDCENILLESDDPPSGTIGSADCRGQQVALATTTKTEL